MARLALSVLLVEDSPLDAELVTAELSSAYDLTVERVDTAPELAAALERRSWDVILCDYNLPGFGAFEALELYKERGADAPFLIISGTIGEEAVVQALKAGVRSAVLKSNLPRLVPVIEQELADAEGRRRQREAEEALRESEARLRLALDAARMLVWSHALETDEMAFDGDSGWLFGEQPPTTFAGFAELIHPDDRKRLAWATRERLAGRPGEVELRVVCHGGVENWVRSRGRLVEDDSGRPLSVVGVAADVTERKQADEELRAANELVQAIVRAAPAAIVTADRPGRVTMWNPAAERMFGWRAEEVLGRPLPHLAPGPEELDSAMRERALAGEEVRDLEVRRLRKDGTVIEAMLSLTPLRDARGEISGVMGTTADISEQVRARREALESLELLRRSGEERGRLLARLVGAQEDERRRIASDIHDDSVQVMTALTLRLDLLRRRIEDPEILELLAEIERTARLSISRLRHLMFELRPPVLDREGLAAALRLYLDQAKTDHGLDWSLDVCLEREPDVELRAVAYRIAQEAIVNVTKHAGARHVDVRVATAEDGTLVRVTDDGRGFKAGEEEERPGHLGLASMRERAEMVGGWWRIDSAPERGTTVEFLVPNVLARLEQAAD